MNIENIEAFILVNHFGSINKASKALFLSQPTVTARIQSLERELDTKLFDRVGKQLVITEQAKEFLPFAERIIQTYKTGKKRMKEKEGTDQLVIGSTRLANDYLIPYIIPKIAEKYENVKMKLHTGSSDEILQKVLDREVDIGFVSNQDHTLVESSAVLESPIRLFVQPEHRLAKTGTIDVEEIAKEDIVFFECGSLDWSMVHNLFQNLPQVPDIKYEVDSMEAAKELLLNGTGIGFLPEICVRKELRANKLQAVDIPILSKLSLKTDSIYYKGEKPTYFDSIYQIAKNEGSNIEGI